MATVTGFTAERMLTIENETVVDGEVRDTNLFLIRRDGVEIDAGWVKGSPGGMGPQGPPGVIQSINDESKPIAYSPRVFDTKADLDAWVNAPYGSVGVVRDGSQTIWQKDTVGWFLVNGMRIFTSTTERDSRWLNPPDGSICQAPIGTEYRRVGGVWVAWLTPDTFALGWAAYAVGPAASMDVTAYNFSIVRATWTQKAHRRYKVSAGFHGTQISANAVTCTGDLRNDSAPFRETFSNLPLTSGVGYHWLIVAAKPWPISTADVPGQHVDIAFGTNGGGIRVAASTCHILVEDIGPG